jgi:ABC-type bacteriocin/lantibiotic exporter with double-glycine peptidase domain
MLSEDAVTLDLPLVRQDELYECGLSAISALCQYWGVALPSELRMDLAKHAADEEGLSGAQLRTALESVGMETFLFRGSLDRSETGIYKHVDAGRPLVVMLAIDGDRNHYCLVLGYDEPRRSIVLLDPARGEVLRPVDAFERTWANCERFTLLACPKVEEGELPSGPGPLYRGDTRPRRDDP